MVLNVENLIMIHHAYKKIKYKKLQQLVIIIIESGLIKINSLFKKQKINKKKYKNILKNMNLFFISHSI